MKKRQLLVILFFCSAFIIIFYACRKENNSELLTQPTQSVSLKEAQMIYSYAGKEIEARFASKYHSISPQWHNMQAVSLGRTHNALYIPVAFDSSTGNYLHIIAMKDEGRLRSMLIEIQPDVDWRRSHNDLSNYKNVTGKLLFYSINGRFHQGYSMKDGGMIKEYTPESELKSISALIGANPGAGGAKTLSTDPCVYGTFGCQELAEVVIAYTYSANNQMNLIYINIPVSSYNSSLNGGTYNGYNWVPYAGGSGNSQAPPPPCDPTQAAGVDQSFINQVQFTPGSSNNVNCPSGSYGQSTFYTSEVVLGTGGVGGLWSIRAVYNITYVKTHYTMVNPVTTQDWYNITNYSAGNAYYVGTNTAITTTYTTVTPTSNSIINNNSATAYGRSQFSGTVTSTSNVSIPVCNLKPSVTNSLNTVISVYPK